MTTTPPPAPECDRMVAVAPFSQHVGDFLDWLEEQGIHLAEYQTHRGCDRCDYAGCSRCELIEPRLVPRAESTTKLLARFYEIDLDKVEAERRAILDSLR